MKTMIVTARVVRENEQYSYKVVGKGEQYLVKGPDSMTTEQASAEVIKQITPYAKEPVTIEQVRLVKNCDSFVSEEMPDGCDFTFYKLTFKYTLVTEEGRRSKVMQNVIVGDGTITDAISTSAKNIGCNSEFVTSAILTPIIDMYEVM
ncbi:MAG TPA: DUF4494 family protein [Paludibacteraceae bacterium]|nr:DUF4494 family protein [Paludibacteraceae bacterium]HOU68040.1 DUF4494 family protein [Paludibacteraceae bacterium]HPH63295.1 DUF4494 family protein [Paludibacteraceae bacterium]HQF49965.1 DUF4494 family protein [Paludibacteraceae bacterium]